jgi:hypothetical protein
MSAGTFALSVVGVVVGLAILLVAEYLHLGDALVYGGGAVALAAVGVMTVAIARLEGEEEHGHDHGGGH